MPRSAAAAASHAVATTLRDTEASGDNLNVALVTTASDPSEPQSIRARS
jgi:hypothetical protein